MTDQDGEETATDTKPDHFNFLSQSKHTFIIRREGWVEGVDDATSNIKIKVIQINQSNAMHS